MKSTDLGSIHELAPTVNFAARAEALANTVWGPRKNPDFQLFYILSGEAEALIGGQRYLLAGGDCVIYGSLHPHRLRTLNRTEYISLHFHLRHASPEPVHPAYALQNCSEEEMLHSADSGFTIEVPGHDRLGLPAFITMPALEPYLLRIVQEYSNEQPGYAVYLRALMTELITALVRHLLNRQPPSAERIKIEPALAAIGQHPEANWTVTELAGLCGYHAIYFSSLFKKCTGVTPKQYLISERIRKAKYHLLQGEKMERIAERLGYASIHYFSRNFKDETGLTPTEFKQQEHEI